MAGSEILEPAVPAADERRIVPRVDKCDGMRCKAAEDLEMLSDLVIAAVNEALRAAAADKAQRMEKISGGLNMPGLF